MSRATQGGLGSVVGTSPTLSLIVPHHNPSLQVGGPCPQDDRQLRETRALGHLSTICPSVPSVELGRGSCCTANPNLAFLSPHPQARGVQREWVEGSAGSWGPSCGGWSPGQGAAEHQPLGFSSLLEGFLVTCCSRAHLESSGRWCGSEASPWDSVSPVGFGAGGGALLSASKCWALTHPESHSLSAPWGTDGETEAWGA